MGRYRDRFDDLYSAAVLDQRRCQEALVALDAEASTWGDVRLVSIRAHIKLLAGDGQGALADFGRAIELEQECGSNYYNRGWAHEQLGMKREALCDFSRCAEIAKATSDEELLDAVEHHVSWNGDGYILV